MPSLNWIGKEAVEHHHKEVPYRLVHCDGALSAGDPDAGNLLVQGDNLEALKALLPYYGGQVKCIYIDPPYNTGNEGWVYNDNTNSPEIRAWLGRVVGKEAEDLSRHDKWLCMMYPRLRLLRDFLTDDGCIFISIDDNEVHHLIVLMNEIFGPRKFKANFIWKKRTGSNDAKDGISADHDFVVCFGRSDVEFIGELKTFDNYRNPDDDPRGPWMADNLTCNKTKEERPNLFYPITDPTTGVEYACNPVRVWAYERERMEEVIRNGKVIFPQEGRGSPMYKRHKAELRSDRKPFSTIIDTPINSSATKLLRDIFGAQVFDYPKGVDLVQKLIEQVCGPNDIVLDSFAGSGTTGHAVLDLNKRDGGSRRFILVEMIQNIAETVTAERLRRVIDGYDRGGDAEKPVPGLGGGFRYCRLGVPLFNEFGDIDGEVSFPDLAAHVFFAETGAPIPAKAQVGNAYLGKHGEKAVYLLYAQGLEGTPREALGNVLTPDALAALPPVPEGFEGARVVYAEGSTVAPDRLKAEGVVFKQIPYQIAGV